MRVNFTKHHIERCKIRNLEKLDYKPLSREKCSLKARAHTNTHTQRHIYYKNLYALRIPQLVVIFLFPNFE
jgi:hypothetical protein